MILTKPDSTELRKNYSSFFLEAAHHCTDGVMSQMQLQMPIECNACLWHEDRVFSDTEAQILYARNL